MCDVRTDALFKTFDLSKYPLLKEGLINHKFVRLSSSRL
jgi:hypothetical protein